MTRRRFSRAALLQPLFVSGAPNSSPLVNCAVLRKTLPKVFLPLALLIWACTPGKAHAATQGTLNATSSGDVTITYVQGLNARISGFTDFALGDWSGSGPMSANGTCVVFPAPGGASMMRVSSPSSVCLMSSRTSLIGRSGSFIEAIIVFRGAWLLVPIYDSKKPIRFLGARR